MISGDKKKVGLLEKHDDLNGGPRSFEVKWA